MASTPCGGRDGLRLIIEGAPVTKKNSQRIITIRGHSAIMPSKNYKRYEKMALRQLMVQEIMKLGIVANPVNVKCVYYMPTRRRVDLANLLEATCDILVAAGILQDDNSQIVAGHDGSRVRYDKDNPRAEIEIEEMSE